MLESMVWDPRGQRLAVALGGSHPEAGAVALYDTRCDPILSARFIGFIRLRALLPAGGKPDSRHADEEIEVEGAHVEQRREGRGGEGHRAGASAMSPTRQAFWGGFNQGALLAVRTGACVATIPLYFSS